MKGKDYNSNQYTLNAIENGSRDVEPKVLDLYSVKESKLPTEDQPIPLLKIANKICTKTESIYNKQREVLQSCVDQYIEFERHFVSKINTYNSTTEKLVPYPLIVMISAMTGAILTRRRNILLRATTPILFGTLTAIYFYTENPTSLLYKSIEKSRLTSEYVMNSTSNDMIEKLKRTLYPNSKEDNGDSKKK